MVFLETKELLPSLQIFIFNKIGTVKTEMLHYFLLQFESPAPVTGAK